MMEGWDDVHKGEGWGLGDPHKSHKRLMKWLSISPFLLVALMCIAALV
ncbi:hypothetical protein FDI24_gp120 [Acidovorax phage ACP17]|uniref:Uncharacterized protein n=1 Tax=Acidovorax phage ACP17 TaxID=2010329 RepID=A0A218M2Y3_9CAUD|nr:hypothetical protein FDI24_gp120 [Acidovorax phage ACP17]ASD50400.1 hypothetical protein [Acidovorax phage ACP17]